VDETVGFLSGNCGAYICLPLYVEYEARTVFHPFRQPPMAPFCQSFLCESCPPSGYASRSSVAEWVLWYEHLDWLFASPVRPNQWVYLEVSEYYTLEVPGVSGGVFSTPSRPRDFRPFRSVYMIAIRCSDRDRFLLRPWISKIEINGLDYIVFHLGTFVGVISRRVGKIFNGGVHSL
jgi:hypothetical protein